MVNRRILAASRPKHRRMGDSVKGGWLASGSELARRAVTAECNQFCHPVQRYAAIQCNGMPSAITKWCAKSHPRHRRAVAQRRFDQDVVGVRRWRVWCGLRRPNRNQRFEFQTVWMRISACWRKSTIERNPIGGALPTSHYGSCLSECTGGGHSPRSGDSACREETARWVRAWGSWPSRRPAPVLACRCTPGYASTCHFRR